MASILHLLLRSILLNLGPIILNPKQYVILMFIVYDSHIIYKLVIVITLLLPYVCVN